MREKPSYNAEVDYAISVGTKIIPVEVKAGKTGTLKSLQVFLKTKAQKIGVRVNSAPPTWHTASYALSELADQSFELVSMPFYSGGAIASVARRETKRWLIHYPGASCDFIG